MSQEASISKRLAAASAFLQSFPADAERLEASAHSAASKMASTWGIGGQLAAVLLLAHFGHRENATLTATQAKNAVEDTYCETSNPGHLLQQLESLADSMQQTGLMLWTLGESGISMEGDEVKRIGTMLMVLGRCATQGKEPCAHWVA